MNELEDLFASRPPTAERPLLGVTVLVVEDSKYACEALRLLCLKSGARIRRASCLTNARKHLQTYRPTVVLVDLGLPDGSGTELIKDLSTATPRVDVLLGSSGDADGEARAIEAGADGFLPKPVSSLAAFQATLLRHLPSERLPTGPRRLPTDQVAPDPVALRDDLAHVADLLSGDTPPAEVDYITQFLHSVALSAEDAPLSEASEALARRRLSGAPLRPGLARLAELVQARLAEPAPIL